MVSNLEQFRLFENGSQSIEFIWGQGVIVGGDVDARNRICDVYVDRTDGYRAKCRLLNANVSFSIGEAVRFIQVKPQPNDFPVCLMLLSIPRNEAYTERPDFIPYGGKIGVFQSQDKAQREHVARLESHIVQLAQAPDAWA